MQSLTYNKPMIDEYLDLVDVNDEIIGKKLRSEIYAGGLSNFRAVGAFLVNSDGRLWLPRRAVHKGVSPLCLDMSMGGHVKSGETYEQAFKRELKEELSIDANATPWRILGRVTPYHDKTPAFIHMYEIQTNEVPKFNKNDFVEYFWFTPDELRTRMNEGEKTKEELPILVNKFYGSIQVKN